MATKRPWKVFVRAIGPTFSYASEAGAHAKAAALVAADGPDRFAKVDVYSIEEWGAGGQLVRVQYRYGQEPARQVLVESGDQIGWRDEA